MKLTDTLSTTAWAMHHFGSICTGGNLKRRDIRRAEEKGLVESVGMVAMCDGDGFTIDPERYREGFKLTKDGEAMLRKTDPDAAAIYLENS